MTWHSGLCYENMQVHPNGNREFAVIGGLISRLKKLYKSVSSDN